MAFAEFVHMYYTYLSHSCSEEDIFKHLPIEIFSSVIHTTLFQQQLQQSNGLLCSISIHLRHVQVINKN